MATPVPALERAARILELMRADPQRRFRAAEISSLLRIHRSSCFALLAALVSNGLVDRHDDGPEYSLGAGLITLGTAAAASHPGFELARRQMFALANALDVGCLVVRRVGIEAVVLDSIGATATDPSLLAGSRSALDAPRSPIFFAWASEADLRAWIERSNEQGSEDEERYLRTVAAVRARGYSVGGNAELQLDLEQLLHLVTSSSRSFERISTLRAFADLVRRAGTVEENGKNNTSRFIIAPIFDRDSQVVMAMTLFAMFGEFDQDSIASHAEHLLEATDRVSRSIGGAFP